MVTHRLCDSISKHFDGLGFSGLLNTLQSSDFSDSVLSFAASPHSHNIKHNPVIHSHTVVDKKVGMVILYSLYSRV